MQLESGLPGRKDDHDAAPAPGRPPGALSEPRPAASPVRARLAGMLLTALASAYVLILFLLPVARHAGINQHPEALFPDMIRATAARPFVTRALIPAVVRFVECVTPREWQSALALQVDSHEFTRRLFERLHWGTADAFPYLVTSILLWVCFALFAHYAARLTIHTCRLRDSPLSRTGLGLLALAGLPPFFRYTSFVYDPPQLALFAACLFLIAANGRRQFLLPFSLACVNKETAIFLLPVWWFVADSNATSRHVEVRKLARYLGWLVFLYGVVRLSILIPFWNAPGNLIEWHLLDHNVHVLAAGWNFVDLAVAGLLIWLVISRWRSKPRMLRISLICMLPGLVGLALLFGYCDEWRDYLEVYPVLFALAIDSIRRISAASG